MKLLRYGAAGAERPGLLDAEGHIRDLSGLISDIDSDLLSGDGLERLALVDPESLPLVGDLPRIGPCVGKVRNFYAIGLNYADHAAETNSRVPPEPILFSKAVSCISGPNDPVIIPRDSQKTDWEVELGIVIGKRASYVEEDEAMEHVAGYCLVNDVSEREFQVERKGQWIKGKSAETFGPIGPWLVTRDEIPDPQNVALFLDVNGERKQTGNTGTMVYGVRYLVSYLSRFMVLLPGDIIATGTPPGVGMGFNPPQFLKPGDTMRLGGAGLGEQFQVVQAWRRR